MVRIVHGLGVTVSPEKAAPVPCPVFSNYCFTMTFCWLLLFSAVGVATPLFLANREAAIFFFDWRKDWTP